MDHVDIMYKELRRHGGQQRVDSIWICCPFHSDDTPSLSVAMTNEKVMVGTFYCFGCRKSGNWNVLASKIGAQKLNLKLIEAESESTVRRIRDKDLSGMTTASFLDTLGFKSHTKWPSPEKTRISFFKEWYSIPGKLLHSLDDYLVIERSSRSDQQNQHRMFLPVKVYGEVRGGIRVIYKKSGIQRTYLNTDGDWTKAYGLFPYDFVHSMIKSKKYPFIVLVEGPRDALTLINIGIPAVAILGSQSFGEKKALIVSGTANIDTVYVMPDSDSAGKKMVNLVARYLRDQIKVKAIRLPTKEVDGEIVHSDPHSVGSAFLKKVVRALSRSHKVKIGK